MPPCDLGVSVVSVLLERLFVSSIVHDNGEEFYEIFQKPKSVFFNDHSNLIAGSGPAGNGIGPGPGTRLS